MCKPNQTFIEVLQKIYSAGKLNEIIYRIMPEGDVFCMEITEEMLQEFEYPADEPCYINDGDGVRPYTTFITPESLTDKQIQTMITAMHDSDSEPLYTAKEYQHKVGLEISAEEVHYPLSFSFEIEQRKLLGTPINIFSVEVEPQAPIKVWATYSQEEGAQIKRIIMEGINVLPLLTIGLAKFKNAYSLFEEIEKLAGEEFQRLKDRLFI